MTDSEIAAQGLALVTPGTMTYGDSLAMLRLCKRFALSGHLTKKQAIKVTQLIAKGNTNAHK